MKTIEITNKDQFFKDIFWYKKPWYKNTVFKSNIQDEQLQYAIEALNIKKRNKRIEFVGRALIDFIIQASNGEAHEGHQCHSDEIMVNNGHIARINGGGQIRRNSADNQFADDEECHRRSTGGEDLSYVIETRIT